ncbi:GNAT family N-acetyltransferase [Kordiimonas sediminis]|nr:GNAT family N-acetyltransferase [Kordiimonas sediminis]
MTVTLTRITEANIQTLYTLLCDESVWTMAASIPPYPTLEWVRGWVALHETEESLGRAVHRGLLDSVGALCGHVSYFTNQDGEIEIGYMIGHAYRGKGLATAAARAIIALARANGVSGDIYAGTAKDNPASGRILQKLGFAEVGENVVSSKGRTELMEGWVWRLPAPSGGDV